MLGAREARAACFAEDTVVRLVEGELDELSRAPLHEHMARCDDCRRLVANVAKSLGEPEHGGEVERSLPSGVSVSILPAGSHIGRYELMERIGAGGTGIIYRAHDPQLRRDLALKLLRPDLSHSAADARARLLREARAMARLAHPNVVSVYDAGVHDEQVFVAMELVEGQTLKHWLKRERRDVGEVLAMFAATARGLEAAHAAGLVHRDFKPSNVLVGRDNRPRVTDFGLARPVALTDAAVERPLGLPADATDQTMTLTGTLIGTPAYMAPEQFRGAPTDARTDQFSFCVALYEALHAKRPFSGETLEEIAAAVLAGKPEPVISQRVPNHVAKALLRGLSADPGRRFPSMAALIDAFEIDPALRPPRRGAGMRKLGSMLALSAVVAGIALAAFGLLRPAPPAIAQHEPITLQANARRASPAPVASTAMPAISASAKPVQRRPEPFVPSRDRQTPVAPSASTAAPEVSAQPGRELIRDPWALPP